tara:strand:- start:264 stop:518 length:255 start_codon:yes stop_codon:yes gene_type:complete
MMLSLQFIPLLFCGALRTRVGPGLETSPPPRVLPSLISEKPRAPYEEEEEEEEEEEVYTRSHYIPLTSFQEDRLSLDYTVLCYG